ncbi:uncharacterized protein LOC112345547 [Selaginella moellendorffii]|uniref:uncharacterized protein LOC112345547 n=1 Tax=Selaginella moellendorffii TaxID=88036 RepID=UPI000D1D0FCF|nr:uncharacterized protein LOC112345547 [Selaginella moellendorffii]|eukprot:XP_024528319.1 uncharacterized protein LOC112345547 [Selaginella moellendorffii]
MASSSASFSSLLQPQVSRSSGSKRKNLRTRSGRTVRISCEKSSEEMRDVKTLVPPSGGSFRKQLTSMPCSSGFRDWRSFRAALLMNEAGQQQQQQPHQAWAHQISCLEPGSVLVATSAVQRHSLFQNSVVLIIQSSESSCKGLILNKLMPFPVDDVPLMEPDAIRLAELTCPAFVAGPHFPFSYKPQVHLLTSSNHLRGYRTLTDGLYLGQSHTLRSTVSSVQRGLVDPEDVRILVNEVEWERQQLEVEIRASNWWKILSCSSDTLLQVPASQLWRSLTRHLE